MKKLVGFMVLGLFSLPMMAQGYPKAQLFAGYQYEYLGGSAAPSTISGSLAETGESFNGFNGSLAYNFGKHVGLAADFGAGFASFNGLSARFYSYTAGPVVSFRSHGKFTPFFHALIGGAHAEAGPSYVGLSGAVSQNGLAALIGGGADYRLKRSIGLRLFQADWLYYDFPGINDGPSFSQGNNVRISTGVVLGF